MSPVMAPLANVPPHWKIVQTRRVATVRNGADYRPVEVPDGGYPVYGSGGEFRRSAKYLFDGESVLFGRKGTVDRPLLVSGRFWTVDTMFYTELQSTAEARFFYYVALTVPFAYYATNTAVPSMTQNDLSSHPIPLPPLDEQRAIADYLDRETAQIDTLIAEQQRLIELLHERRQSAVDSALQTEAPVVPLRRLAEVVDCAHVTAAFVDDDTRFPVASIRECQGRVVDLSACRYTTRLFFELLRNGGRAPRSGDLLFVRNVSVGLVSEVHEGHPEFALGQETVLLRRIGDTAPTYLRWALTSSLVQAELERAMIGSTFRRINVSQIRALPVPLPPLDEQRRIVAELDEVTAKIDTLIAEAERFIELSKERRSALITAAVTGQIEIPGVA
ncbi:MAG: restriction endonuclease subunit S [Microthrixaceae bacterium]